LSFLSSGFPLFLEYKERNPSSPSSVSVHPLATPAESHVSLNQTLADPHGVIAFEEYLKLEFSVENLMFYFRVKEYRDNFQTRSGFENSERAIQIYHQFLHRKSPFQVNLPSLVIKPIESLFVSYRAQTIVSSPTSPETIREGIFEPACQQVYQLMSNDTFQRFKKSDIFKRMIMSTAVPSATALALRASMIAAVPPNR
jgi:hypothetical protein